MKTIFLTFICLLSLTAFCQKNLVKNGSLDSNTDYWNGNALKNNPYDKISGAASGMIIQFTGFEWKGVDQVFTIPKATFAIEFSAWIKGEAIEGGKDKWNAGIMTAAFTTGSGTEISSENIAELHGTKDWELYKKIVMVPGGAKSIRIMLALAQTTGTILYDDIKAIVVTEDEYLKQMQKQALPNQDETLAKEIEPQFLKNGNFEEGLANWNGNGSVVNINPKEGTACAAITSISPNWVAIDQTADITAGTRTIEFSGWLKGQNIIQGKDPWNHGMLIVEFTTDGKTKAANDTNLVEVSGTTEWTMFNKTLPVPDGAKRYRIMLALNNAAGTLMADDLKINLLKE